MQVVHRVSRSLTAKLAVIGSVLLACGLASIGLTMWVTWQLGGGAAAVNEAGRIRMQTWRLVHAVQSDRAAVPALVAEFDASIELLRAGDPKRPLFVPVTGVTRERFDAVRARWQELRVRWAATPAPEAAQLRADAGRFVEQIDAFVDAIEVLLARWTAILNLVQLAWIALAIGSAVVIIYAGYRFVFDPLFRLKAGLERVQHGEFDARVERVSQDEFGAVTEGFNRMAGTLQELYRGLEDKVREKTARLGVEHARLAALYDVSALLAKAVTLEELARGFAPAVRRIAGADAAVIRWSDEANARYVLLAADAAPGPLLDTERCIEPGRCLCGRSSDDAATRVIPIARAGAPLRPEPCLRAGFETLVSVPIRLHLRLLGEVDLLFRRELTLSADDRSLLEALASHLAGAMESLRAAALEREAAVADERGLLARELHDSIAQSLAFLKIQVQLLRVAVARSDRAAIERSIAELEAGVRESTSDVRELLVHFRTRTNQEDIEPALRTTLSKFEHQSGLGAHLAVSGHGLPLDPDVQVQVLHVVQEALSNVRKHADARQVWVDLQRAPHWRIEVRDDGHGFDPAAAASGQTHVGLRIMRERAARIGAQVQVLSEPGAGTRVILTLARTAARPRAAQPA
jgi:two-component system nitrate/nitrite sensor histidine kinase NarX